MKNKEGKFTLDSVLLRLNLLLILWIFWTKSLLVLALHLIILLSLFKFWYLLFLFYFIVRALSRVFVWRNDRQLLWETFLMQIFMTNRTDFNSRTHRIFIGTRARNSSKTWRVRPNCILLAQSCIYVESTTLIFLNILHHYRFIYACYLK